MVQLTDKVFAVEVPGDASPYILDSANGKGQGLFWTQPGVQSPPWKDLPPGTWRFLFTTKTATEEQAASVVQIISNGKISGRPQYRRYDRDNELPARMWTRDSRHSLETLLRSKGLDDKNNYALIEKENTNE